VTLYSVSMARSSARGQVALAALRAVATECQAPAASFSDEHAAAGLTITDDLCAIFEPPALAPTGVAGPVAQLLELLSAVPPELMSIIMSQLDTHALARLAATCRSLWFGAPTPPPLSPTPGLVETWLRRRAEARSLQIGLSLPAGVLSWVPYLLKRDFYDTLRREVVLVLGAGVNSPHSIFVDRKGRLHVACRRVEIKAGGIGEPLLRHDLVPAFDGSTMSVPPTLVSSMQDKRIVSVATGIGHCLALSAEGEVYSWGNGSCGVLGHADGSARAGPRRIETLARVRVESIAAGLCHTSVAVDYRGRLFTWGRASLGVRPTGLGYELDPETEFQPTPKRVDALSEERVVGVALGNGFTLAVTDAGAVFSFGLGPCSALGHGSSEAELLPRRIEALSETGQHFVAVAAGDAHALALTEEGHVYGWGYESVNGHDRSQRKPQLVTALAGVHVKLLYAHKHSACAVTEKGELYTWGGGLLDNFHLGHGWGAGMPKRVEALSRVKVAAAAICSTYSLAAGADGVVWAFGTRAAFGLSDADAPSGGSVVLPTPIPTTCADLSMSKSPSAQ